MNVTAQRNTQCRQARQLSRAEAWHESPPDEDAAAEDCASDLFEAYRRDREWLSDAVCTFLAYRAGDGEGARTQALDLIASGADDALLGQVVRAGALVQLQSDCEAKADADLECARTEDDDARAEDAIAEECRHDC